MDNIRIPVIDLIRQTRGVGVGRDTHVHWLGNRYLVRMQKVHHMLMFHKPTCSGCGQNVEFAELVLSGDVYSAYFPIVHPSGRMTEITRDHIVPKSRSGSNNPVVNLDPMCRICNQLKCDQPHDGNTVTVYTAHTVIRHLAKQTPTNKRKVVHKIVDRRRQFMHIYKGSQGAVFTQSDVNSIVGVINNTLHLNLSIHKLKGLLAPQENVL